MTELVDLVSAARAAVFNALDAAVPPDLCAVYDDIPQNAKPPYLKIGAIDNVNDESKGDQFEQITVEVFASYQGKDRGVLIAMMFAARKALDRQKLTAEGANFLRTRFVKGSATDANPMDGVTYVGLQHFEIWAERG